MYTSYLFLLIVILSSSCCESFTIVPFAAAKSMIVKQPSSQWTAAEPRTAQSTTTTMWMSKRRKRVRRKDAPPVENPEPTVAASSTPPPPELKPREEATVSFQVQDVRDVVSGKSTTASEQPKEDTTSLKDNVDDDDDDEWEYVDIDEEEDNDEYEYVVEDASGRPLDSMEQLLADAKSMRVSEEAAADDKDEDEEGFSIPQPVLDAIGTIVTVDFFIVLALLGWFLAGIFFSSVMKDDAVQIAFNNNFETLVQPALGVLMIGSAAGAVFRQEGEEEP